MASILASRKSGSIATCTLGRRFNALSRSFSSVELPRNGETFDEPIPEGYTIDSVKPPKYWSKPDPPEEDPMAYRRKPVTSAHAIDLTSNPPKISLKDSAVITPNGSVMHGRYGELPPEIAQQGIPLEYLALLHPASEGAAALRQIAKKGEKGTVLVYAAGDPHAMSAAQLASADGHTVMAVLSGKHSGNGDFFDALKSSIKEPGTVITEEFACVKNYVRELVLDAVEGEDPSTYYSGKDADAYVDDFLHNALEYAKKFPEGIPAAVAPETYKFTGKEKDRKYHKENITAYLSQFPGGAPPLDTTALEANFTKRQYAAFKSKFGKQTSAVISSDKDAIDPDFLPSRLLKNMSEVPEKVDDYLLDQKHAMREGDLFVPYEFSVLHNNLGNGLETIKGGPILGAVIGVTTELKTAAEAVANAGKSLRAKAEALHFLTTSERNAFTAARSIVALAEAAGKPVIVVGGELPELQSVIPSDEDVQEALSAMEIEEDGTSRLNYFLQLYRASDYPVYEEYAIHRATEELPGPRQIIVTK